MPRNRHKIKKSRFIGIPFSVARTAYFAKLRSPECKLLLDLLLQYYGSNNGMLSPCHTLMKERGWAKSSLHRAFNKLQHAGFLVVTRQGWKRRGKATLVAITWLPIDEPINNTEYDEGVVSGNIPLDYWCKAKKGWKHKPSVKEILNIHAPQSGGVNAQHSPKLELVAGGKCS